jgi:hypothetical protein
LNDTLEKLPFFPMFLKPDLFKGLVTLEEQLLIEFFNPLKITRVVLVTHIF